MTDARPAGGVDAEMIEGGRRRWVTALIAVVIGLVIGAVLGTLVASTRTVSYQAQTQISITPDSSIDQQLQDNQPDLDAQTYIQGELVTLNGAQLEDKVRDGLGGGAKPSISASEVGQTYVVQIAASAASRARAVRAASLAADSYASTRKSRLTDTIDTALSSARSRIRVVRNRLADEQKGQPADSPATPAETALQTEYERLLSTSSSLAVERARAGNVVTVVTPSRAVAASVSTRTKWALAGGVIGAVLALLLLFAARRAVPRLRSVGDLAALNVPVILPVLPRRRGRAARGTRRWQSSAARILAARLSGSESGPPLVVVGASHDVGTSFVATSLATAIADQGPVLLVLASADLTARGGVHSPPAATDLVPADDAGAATPERQPVQPSTINGVWLLPDGLDLVDTPGVLPSTRSRVLIDALGRASEAGWRVVVDAPALSESNLATDCLAAGAHAVLVVGRGISNPADVISGVELFEARGSGFLGVLVNDVPRGIGRFIADRRRRPLPAAEPGQSLPAPVGAVPPGTDLSNGRRRAAAHEAESDPPVPAKRPLPTKR